jgi:hypothetical protein
MCNVTLTLVILYVLTIFLSMVLVIQVNHAKTNLLLLRAEQLLFSRNVRWVFATG